MQKKVIALAVAGLVSGAAFAQSNVTIYGVADMTFDRVSASNQGSAAAAFQNNNRVTANSSILGFKGEEALGNGLKAVFQFEGGGGDATGNAFSFSRDTFAGIDSDKFGKVVAGQLTGPTRALGAALDVNAGATGTAWNGALLGKLGGALTNYTTTAVGDAGTTSTGAATVRSSTQASTFDTRFKNSIAYTTPTFAGLSATGMYIANENKTNAINTQGYDLGLNYKNGPIFAGLTYNALTLNNDAANTVPASITGSNVKLNELRAAAMYDFGVATVRGLYARTGAKSDTVGASAGVDQKQNVWGLGGTYNVTSAGKITGQFYKASDITAIAGDQGAKFWSLGYEHSLSKRTVLKANFARVQNKANAAYDFGVNATGATTLGGANLSAVQLGIRHSF